MACLFFLQMLDIPSAKRDLQSTYCFDAQYILTLLSKGYRFNTTQAATLRFVSSVSGRINADF